MRRARRIIGVLLVAGLVCAPQAGAVEHIGVSRTDKFLMCAREIFGNPVFRATTGFRRSAEIDIACPPSREALMQELKGTGTYVQPEQIEVIEQPDMVFLWPSSLYAGPNPRVRWKRLSVVTKVQEWARFPGTRGPTPHEAETVRSLVLKQARTPPLLTPFSPGADGETATLEVVIAMNVARLSASPVESVIAFYNAEGGIARLVYGEIREGKYELLWDSPLFRTQLLEFGYRDMDGDGVQEILLSSHYGRESTMFTVFDSKGHELTRQAQCEVDFTLGYTEEGGVCAITGKAIELEVRADGKRDIVVMGRLGSTREDQHKSYRYSLVDGRYVVQEAQPQGKANKGGSCANASPVKL